MFLIYLQLFRLILCSKKSRYGQLYSNDSSLINTPNGLIQGSVFANKTIMFRSIPYAEPPTDQLRWSSPLPKAPWGPNETLYALDNPPGCPQRCSLPPHGCPPLQSEDCLYLNIFKPINATSSTDLLPVMVWIHGGNFYEGYSGGPIYNGTNMVVESNIIIITINYRLGALGFLWSVTGPSGNYGMLDQILALEWIHENIIYFNGDPNRVTLYGQSAGAMSIGLHMVYNYPHNLNLFQAAIMESNPFGLPFRDTVTWGLLPNNFYNNLGCNYDRLSHNEAEFWQCLRNKTVDEIISAQMITQLNPINEIDHFWDLFLPWSPTMGTDLFAEQAFWSFQKGNYVDIPYIIGVVENEAVSFVWEAIQSNLSRTEVVALMEILVGNDDTHKILQQYPLPSRENTSDYRPYASVVITDGLFRCPSWNTSMEHSKSKTFESFSWFYHFNYVSNFNEQFWGTNYSECNNVVCHAAELPYVFHPNGAPDNITYLPEENTLACIIQIFWSNLAKYHSVGTQNEYNLTWKEFELNQQYEMIFDLPQSRLLSNYDNSTCQFWNTLNYNWIK